MCMVLFNQPMKAHSSWNHHVWTVGRLNRIQSQPKSIFRLSLALAMLRNKIPISSNIYQKLISIWIKCIRNLKANRHFRTALSLNLCFCSFIIWSPTVSESDTIHNSPFFESWLCLSVYFISIPKKSKIYRVHFTFGYLRSALRFYRNEKTRSERRLLSIEIHII